MPHHAQPLSPTRRLAVAIGAGLALLVGAFGASPAHADDPKYYFLVDAILLKNDAPELLKPLIRKQTDKFIGAHARLVANLPEDAPDPRAEPTEFQKFVKQAGLDPYAIRLEVINYEREVEPNRRKSGNVIKVSISMRVLGVTLSKSTFGFTGEGSATIKAEVGNKIRERDIKFTNDDALAIAVGDAMGMAVQRLDEKRAEFKRKFRKKAQKTAQEKARQEEEKEAKETLSLTGAPAIRGMALGLYPDGRRDPTRFDHMIDEIVALGASDIALVVTWGQDDIRSTGIAAGAEAIDDATVKRAIGHARARGLRVLLFPILKVRKTRPGQWRGTIDPRDRDAWWRSYENFIGHYADIAAAAGATSLLIGSELSSTETWQYRWYHLISRVQKKFAGALVYSANWDHFDMVSFWRRLDVIGVTGYFSLTDRKDADLATLETGWQRARAQILAYARERGKPLWLTEVGYTSVDGTATRPWDYKRKGKTDHEEQRRCYRAFVKTWDGVALLDGVFIWNWYGRGGAEDRSYTPKGKPAEAVLRDWYQGRR